MIRRPPRSTRTDTPFPTRRSSDLLAIAARYAGLVEDRALADSIFNAISDGWQRTHDSLIDATGQRRLRSEERRVGKECVRTCGSRWSTDHYKTKTNRHNGEHTIKQTQRNKHKTTTYQLRTI